jgi:P27 family predicted phage terminase small subunit
VATPGRKPKPAALKSLAGNPGKRALNQEEPRAQIVRPRAPYGRLPKAGQRLWRSLVPVLADLGVLTETDVPALEMLCLHYATAVEAAHLIREEGLTTCGSKGTLTTHPAVRILRDASSAFRLYAEQFGLTPSARSRIQAVTPEEPDELEQLLFGRRTRVATRAGGDGDG